MESLSELLLTHISKTKNISKQNAAKLIEQCLTKITTQENTSYNRIYNLFHTFTGLSSCLSGSCSKQTLDNCSKLCHCVVFKNKCVPRYISNAIDINDDPDKWIQTLKTTELEELVEYASFLYYNYDGGGLTDNAFDALEYHLNKRLKTRGRKWEKIGADPVEKIKTKLPYPMMSLDKLKPGMNSLLSFISKAKEYGIVWSDKLDGVSGMVVYKGKNVVGMYTRGNGEIGGDVTYLRDYIKLPQVTYNYFVVRGEFILSKNVWETKYKDTYATARSFVSAKINSGYVSEALIDIDFVAYQIIDWSEKNVPTPAQSLLILHEQGFITPSNGLFEKDKQLLTFDVINKYITQRSSSNYTIDGLVLSINIPQPIKQLTNPEFSKAFKMTLEEQLRKTKVTTVDWNITRYGRYFPVAVYESVYIDGVRLHRASCHNAQHIVDWNMGKGTEIIVTRSGDVIPTIKDVIVNPKIQPILPGDKYEWSWKGRDIVLNDIDNNPEVQIKIITHFFTTIQTPQFAEGRIRRVYEAGMTTIKAITQATPAQFKKIKGFGPKLSQSVYDNIHNTMKKTRMDRYLSAVTTFKTNLGKTLLKNVLRYYPQILSASESEIKNHLKKNKIPGIGPKRIDTLAESIPQFMEFLQTLNKDDIDYAVKYQEQRLKELKKKGFNKKIKGKIFVMTGFMMQPHYELEDYISDNWGDISSTISANVEAVISANLANITGKMTKAYELGIPIYSIVEFVKAFDVPIAVKELDELVIPEDTHED